MKILNFNEAGNPADVLRFTEKEKPAPGDNEVLIKVLSSPIQPADIMFIEGRYRFKPEFPQTAGLEGAGIVEASGKNVPDVTGKLVSFFERKAWAEYVVVPKELIVILPDDFPIHKAAQFYLNPFTAWGLLEESKMIAGEWLLLTAANSTVSRLVIQLAKLRGIKVIAAVRDVKQTNELTALGADAVILMEREQFSEQINTITSGLGIHAALDAVGGTAGTKILQSMAANGRVIIYGLLSNEPVQFVNSQIIYKNLEIKGFGIRGFLQGQSKVQRNEMMQTLIKEIAKSSFELPVAMSFSFEQFKEALAANDKRGTIGKIIFKN
jgi:NADPH:quinone reductase-like Zn-dependent oxidoreductase